MFIHRVINICLLYVIIYHMREIEFRNVVIGFTDRKDGNQRVLENRKTNLKVIIPNQKHTTKVISLDEDLTQEADGLYTHSMGVAIGVLTADCMPIVLFNQKEVAVIHAGWRGLFGGIIENAFRIFSQRPTLAFIGPSIRVCCYEVGKEFIEQLSIHRKFYREIEGRFFLSLQDVAKDKIESLGVEVYDLMECTGCSGRYFSFRKGDFDDRILTYAYIKE